MKQVSSINATSTLKRFVVKLPSGVVLRNASGSVRTFETREEAYLARVRSKGWARAEIMTRAAAGV